jgi:hypothetical protein
LIQVVEDFWSEPTIVLDVPDISRTFQPPEAARVSSANRAGSLPEWAAVVVTLLRSA